jgi:hypothetical protein
MEGAMRARFPAGLRGDKDRAPGCDNMPHAAPRPGALETASEEGTAMRFIGLGLVACACAALAAAPARSHATYNLSGYGSGLAGSTNGADGAPTAVPPAEWTNGPVEGYAGGLPVSWYAGMHSATQVRVIQTGLAPNPPAGSLLQQVSSFNAANDPDLPVDRVLAVGGKSWADPDNAGQGWGHGLDFGLIHYSPVEDVLANGPVKFTITLTDDPSDAANPRFGFALYRGWDGNPASLRHQTFVTSPAPVDDPLGASGLELVDFAVASAAGQVVSRTYDLDAETNGEYTLLVGALDGVAGQYQVTISTAADASLGLCEDDLDVCEEDLATAVADADGDGVGDAADACAATPAEQAVDADGCALAEFCAAHPVGTKREKKLCKLADWGNDEPAMKPKEADCTFDRAQSVCLPAQ